MSRIVSIDDQVIQSQGRSNDPRLIIGTGHYFETIDALLLSTDILKEGLLSTDVDNSVTWQIYLDGATWKARIYDGTFYLKSVSLYGTPVYDGEIGWDITMSTIFLNVTLEDGDVVGLFGSLGPLNGIYIVSTTGAWSRHPLFDTAEDSLTGITFVVTDGDYKNSQWRYSTIGTIVSATPDEPFSTTYPDFTTDPETFSTYTWFNFERIGSGMDASYINAMNYTSYVGKYQFNLFTDTTISSFAFIKPSTDFLPFHEYNIIKYGNSVNYIAYAIDTLTGGSYVYGLLKQGDWISVTLLKNTFDKYSDLYTTYFMIKTNREHIRLKPNPILADGKLTLDVPDGYRLFGITGYPYSGTTPPNSILKFGTTSGDDDLIPTVTYSTGNHQWDVVNVSASGANMEVWVSAESGAGWNGATMQFELLIIKE